MEHLAGRRPVVLVVEDEAMLRWHAVAMIEDAGFDVIEAANAAEAIAVLEARTDIRVIFTDIQMPGSIDGLRLAHLVRNRWPPIKIIATSGRLRLRDCELPEGGRFLTKPYSVNEITGTLRELMGA
ncbi:response regulator [Bradyrhizobium archetypum]|uniref:Response regulator n=1 Tax=Bradyrhizobium archetypum TaxID=2721160 RepID=A0A7Y4H757_9BRAD|nr:response regulator [Bradyrhizobium archetypum]NOJ48910.1 response regulator [Bradyrhizobium archetypum]